MARFTRWGVSRSRRRPEKERVWVPHRRRSSPTRGRCSLRPFHVMRRSLARVSYLIQIFMPGRNMSVGLSKLYHNMVLSGDWMTRLSVLRSTVAEALLDAQAAPVTLGVQRTWPPASDTTRFIRVGQGQRCHWRRRQGQFSVLETHTMVNRRMPL